MVKIVVGTSPVLKNSPEKSSGRLSAQSGAVGFQTFPSNFSLPEDLEWENVSIEELLAMATTHSLMGDTSCFRFSGALTGTRADAFLDSAKDLVQSPHQFIFLEEKLLKKAIDELTKAGAEVVIHEAVKKNASSEAFNIFSIPSAFAARDRKKLWLLLQESFQKDVVPEAVAGMLHWKVRDMLSKGGKNAYTRSELERISFELVSLYHDSHRGAGELSLLLERYILLI